MSSDSNRTSSSARAALARSFPGPAAIRIAHAVSQPDHVTFFAYEKGAMMDGVVARAKRVQFFHASHSPDPIDPNLYLNATGLKLLDATIAWCLE